METISQILARELERPQSHIDNVISLLDEGNTIPFIARYRKEMHGTMDDQLIREISDRLTYLRNLDGVNFMKKFLNIYKYSKEGTFDVPTMTVKEFIMLTDEEKLLGVKEQRQKTMYKETIFTEFCRYEVHTEGKDNISIEGGNIIDSLLPFNYKQRLLNGETEINYNGIIIKKLTKLEPKKVQEKTVEKVDVSKMSYQELLDYCKKNNIKSKTNKKADLIAAIKG